MWLGRKHTRKLFEKLLFETLQAKVDIEISELQKKIRELKKSVGIEPGKIPLGEEGASKKENKEVKLANIYQEIEREIDWLRNIYEKDLKNVPYDIKRKTAREMYKKIWNVGKDFEKLAKKPSEKGLKKETAKEMVDPNFNIARRLYNLAVDLEETEKDCYFL